MSQNFEVLITRNGNLIELTGPYGTRLDMARARHVLQNLAFVKKTFLRGRAAVAPDGSRQSISLSRVNMYTETNLGIITGFGMLTKVCTWLQQAGASVRYMDLSPDRLRPDCYKTDWDRVRNFMQFRPRQEECLRLIEANACGLIHAPPGFGKSTMFGAICHLYPQAKIHIVIPVKDVVKKIYAKLLETIPNVGLVTGETNYIGPRVTVFTAGSMHKTDGDCDILLCDEVHEMMTDHQTEKLAQWRTSRNFAFTATPDGRLDGADAQIELFFGPKIFYMSYREAQQQGLVVPIRVRWLDIALAENPCQDMVEVPKTRAGIWRNYARNSIIAQDIRQNYPDTDTQILILVETTDHAVHLWQHLPEFDLCYADMSEEDLAYFKKRNLLPPMYQPMSPIKRDQLRRGFQEGTRKRVIATDVWSTGVDFEKLQVLYRVCGRSSKILDTQAPGRVSRISTETGKEYGEVIDCFDRFDSGFKSKSESRRRSYKALGWQEFK